MNLDIGAGILDGQFSRWKKRQSHSARLQKSLQQSQNGEQKTFFIKVLVKDIYLFYKTQFRPKSFRINFRPKILE
jgi:hypothetical protein